MKEKTATKKPAPKMKAQGGIGKEESFATRWAGKFTLVDDPTDLMYNALIEKYQLR